MPMMTLSLTTSGELVPVEPDFGSPLTAFHTTAPVLASSATTVVSA